MILRVFGRNSNQMKSSTKKILVIGIIVLFIISIIAGILGGHL